MELLIETMGWIGSVLIVGAYASNIYGHLRADTLPYIWMNMVGGCFFVVNTIYHHAYPSAVVNVIWVLIALNAVVKKKAPKE